VEVQPAPPAAAPPLAFRIFRSTERLKGWHRESGSSPLRLLPPELRLFPAQLLG